MKRQSAITLQTGLRAMTAHNEFRFRKQTKAAIIIQVDIVYPLPSNILPPSCHKLRVPFLKLIYKFI